MEIPVAGNLDQGASPETMMGMRIVWTILDDLVFKHNAASRQKLERNRTQRSDEFVFSVQKVGGADERPKLEIKIDGRELKITRLSVLGADQEDVVELAGLPRDKIRDLIGSHVAEQFYNFSLEM